MITFTLCTQQHWKYNLVEHFKFNHDGCAVPEEFLIEKEEEDRVKN